MKKFVALLSLIVFTLFFVLPFFQTTAHAAGAEITLNNGDNFLYLPNFATSELDTITVAPGSTVTIKGAPGGSSALYNIQIVCGSGCTLTLEDVNLDNTGLLYQDFDNVFFTGTGNTLILTGKNSILAGGLSPAIEVNSGTFLTIKGDGSLYCRGTGSGAAIGSEAAKNCGEITIEGNVYIQARTFYYAAAIGGGRRGNGGAVNIRENAYIVAIGNGSGIGGGFEARGGKINISGGYVYARGYDGPGLGGNSSDASVSDEAVKITGGVVFAGTDSPQFGDIGNPGNNKLLEISGDAVVLLEHDSTYPSPTTTHRHMYITPLKDNKLYGYELPSYLSAPYIMFTASAYLPGNVYEIKYNSNGGTPDTYYDIQYPGEPTILSDGSEFSRAHYYLREWNTKSDGSGKTYAIGQSNIFASDANVYAQWEPKQVDSIKLDVTSLSMRPGDSYKPVLTIYPSGAANSSLVQWESSNPSAVTVAGDGTITAVSTGAAVITASLQGKTAHCTVEVSVLLTELIVEAGMYLYDTMPLVAKFIPEDATDKDLTWTSSNQNILQVDSDGVVSAVGIGEATITAASQDNIAGTYNITVMAERRPVTSVSFMPSSLSLNVGQIYTLSPLVLPENSVYDTVEWWSSDTTKASVLNDGTLSLKAPGDVTIQATIAGKTGECHLRIIQPVLSVSLSEQSADIYGIGSSLQLTGSAYPDNAIEQTLIWTSSDTDVASVSQTGKVTSHGLGTAVIRASCGDKYKECTIEVKKRPVTGVTLTPDSLSLYVSEWRTLVPAVSPETATYKDVTWSSGDESVATVDQNGNVQAVSLGTCTVTATCADDASIYAQCSVEVKAKDVDSIEVSPSSKDMYIGDSATLKATVLPKDATSPEVVWSSSDEDVATVDQNGGVRAVGIGECSITAKAGAESAQCGIKVSAVDVSSISLDTASQELVLGHSFTLRATVSPSNATYPDVTWSSSDEDVATVDQNGGVKAVGLGTCAINAEADGKSAQCSVKVVKVGVSSLTLDRISNTLYEGEWFTLNVMVKPSDATYPAVSWTSSDSSVAKVNEVGTVQAVSAGSCVITTSADGVTAGCAVKVEKTPVVEVDSVSLAINSNTVTMLYVGDIVDLVANIYPSNAANKSLTWQSSDTTVASVTQLGRVTAVGVGQAQITVSAGGHSDTYNIAVSERDDDSLASPTPVPTPAPSDSQATPSPEIREVTIITIDTEALPAGTKYILLSNGETVELTGEDTMQISVPLDDSGEITLVALDGERVPLGSVQSIVVSGDVAHGLPALAVLLIVLAAIVVGAGGALIFVRFIINRKK